MNSLEIAEFRNAIIEFANGKDFPLEIKRLVFADILKEITDARDKEVYEQVVERQKIQEENAKAKKGDNK